MCAWARRSSGIGAEERAAVSFIISAASITTIVFGVVALMALGLGVYWLFNKRTR